MKLLLALLVAVCFAGVYSGNEDHSSEKAMVAECAKEANLDIKVLDEIHGENFVPTREMKCFSACVLKKKDLMDANGKYTENFKADKDVGVCPAEYGSDECETAGILLACFKQHGVLEKIKKDVKESA